MTEKLIKINERIVHQFLEQNRPRVEIRQELEWGYSFKNVIELLEIRPNRYEEGAFLHLSFAKIKYVKTQKIWKLYWMRGSGKWQSYEPCREASNLEEFLSVIDEDTYGCFKG